MNLSATGDPVQSTFAGTCRKSACNARSVKVDDIFTISMPRIIGIKYEEQVLEAKSAQSSPTLHLPWWNGLGKIAFKRFSVRDHEFRVHPLCEQPFYRVWLCHSIATKGKLFWSRLSGTPIELEPVGNSMLLGFDASVAERTIRFLCPSQQQIRYVASAGSLHLRLSGFKSRAHLMRTHSFPQSVIQPSLRQLAVLYVQQGYSPV